MKCASSILPLSETAIFKLESTPLAFEDTFVNEKEEYKSGYISTVDGDSGAPIWTKEKKTMDQEQAVLVSIASRTAFYIYRGEMRTQNSCDMHTMKITEDILQWIKVKSGILSCTESCNPVSWNPCACS